jgi:hypothetical protein
LLGEPPVQPQPIARLVQLLAPGAAEQVPANWVSGWLMRRLPLGQPTEAICRETLVPARSPADNRSLR